MEGVDAGDAGIKVEMLVLAAVASLGGILRGAFQMQFAAVARSDGKEPTPGLTECETEKAASVILALPPTAGRARARTRGS